MKRKLTIASFLVLAGVIGVQQIIIQNPDRSIVKVKTYCPVADLEGELREMSVDELNKLMIITSEIFTAHYKESTREQVEAEHERYANQLALEHMNEVMGVLVKSIGAMPTSTLVIQE